MILIFGILNGPNKNSVKYISMLLQRHLRHNNCHQPKKENCFSMHALRHICISCSNHIGTYALLCVNKRFNLDFLSACLYKSRAFCCLPQKKAINTFPLSERITSSLSNSFMALNMAHIIYLSRVLPTLVPNQNCCLISIVVGQVET